MKTSARGPEMSDTKPFTVGNGWLHRLRKSFELNNIVITRVAASADEEATATFPAEQKKLIKKKGTIQSESSMATKLGSSGMRCPMEPTCIKCKGGNRA